MVRTRTSIDLLTPAMRAWRRLPEGTLAEVINGKLHVSPSPTPYHQSVSLKITVDLINFAAKRRLRTVYTAPTDLFLTGHSSMVIPDIIFIGKENSLVIDEKGLHGVPDLLMEILSTNRHRDLTTKKKFYEEAGVKEYWIVDPETKDARGYLLENNKYADALLLNSELYIRILNKSIKF